MKRHTAVGAGEEDARRESSAAILRVRPKTPFVELSRFASR